MARSIEAAILARLAYDLKGQIGDGKVVEDAFGITLSLVRKFARQEYETVRVLVGGERSLLILGTALLVEGVTCLTMSGLTRAKRVQKDVAELWLAVETRAKENADEIAKTAARAEPAANDKDDAPSPLVVV